MKYDSRIILALFLITTFYFLNSQISFAFIPITSEKNVNISAAVLDTAVTIFGYTSPQSRVELTSIGVFAVTYSDNKGYFLFDHLNLPKIIIKELCLSSIDDNERHSFPLCIPPPPPTNYHTDIGPLLLPPTLTLDTDQPLPNTTISASGQSLPNSSVIVYLFQQDHHPSLVSSAQAFSLPQYIVTTDSKGNYNFSLPTTYSTKYRLYSTTSYLGAPSPKSNTLSFIISPATNFKYVLLISIPLILILTAILFYRFLFPHPTATPSRFPPSIYSYPLQLKYVVKE